MRKPGWRFSWLAGALLMGTLFGCGGPHATNGSKKAIAESHPVTRGPELGERVPKLEMVHRFTQDPSWGEDVMIEDVLLGTPRRYYLGDPRAIRILAVDMNGKLLYSFLKKGQGPGEFQWLNKVQKLGDTLWVSGGRKLARFSMDGILRSETRLDHFYYNLKIMDGSRFVGVRVEAEGDGKTGRRVKRAGLWDLKEKRMLKSFRTSDKTGVVDFKNSKMFLTVDFGGGIVPDLVLAADPKTQRIYTCETDTYRIDVLNMDGKQMETIERSVEPAMLTDKDKDDIVGGFRMRGIDPNDFRRQMKKKLPDRLCPVASLQVTPDSYLIVERPVRYGTSELDVYTPTGDFLVTVQNPNDLDLSSATFLSHDRVALLDDKGDVPVVTEYHLLLKKGKQGNGK